MTWVPYTIEYLTEGFDGGFPVGPELALSTHQVSLLTYGGWELYLGERAFRCVIGEIRIPFHLPSRRSWPMDAQISEIPVEGEDGFRLSNGPNTSDAFFIW